MHMISNGLIQISILTLVSTSAWATEVPKRGGDFFNTPERFNRYYTDPNYTPAKTVQVTPSNAASAVAAARAGDMLVFQPGTYNGCYPMVGEDGQSGTHDAPIVLKAKPGVTINCCGSSSYPKKKSCFNLENADYVAIDGFTLVGGDYGIRAVGGYATSEHQTGIAMLNNHGRDQNKDPFFSGGSDWIVVENNIAHGAGTGDGHGIYLSNGSDWMIVRNNETYDNYASDFQINADPISTCEDEGISYSSPLCDGSALDGLGQGASEFILVENNYFHDGRQGPNFTSVRNSVVRNNIIAFYINHSTSFWQETDNPNLGSSNNIVEHNLFIGESGWDHVLQFINDSKDNTVRNNVLLGISRSGQTASANSGVVLVQQDGSTQGQNTFAGNFFVGGQFEDYSPAGDNQWVQNFDPAWFVDFPVGRMGSSVSFKPVNDAPFVASGALLSTTPVDRVGTPRSDPADLGPWQVTLSTPPCTVGAEPVDKVVTYTCEQSMLIAKGFEIKKGGDVTFEAKSLIEFGTRFRVEDKGILRARIVSDNH